MKRLLLFAILFAVPMWMIGVDDIRLHLDEARISSAPMYAPVKVLRTYKTSNLKIHSYRIDYGFEVNGRRYRTTTQRMGEDGVARFLARDDMQVVYYAHDPSINTLKQYFDMRHTRGTLGQSIVVTSLFSAGFALTVMLLAALIRYGFRRIVPAG